MADVFSKRTNEPIRRELQDGAPGFEQSFQMRLGRLLESKGGLATIAPVRVAAGQQGGFGNPHAIFILPELHFREWNDHNGHKVTCSVLDVKEAIFPRRSRPRLNLSTPYLKDVDAGERTLKFWQEIYDGQGKLAEIHEKYPVDKGHQKV
jgi:hypothetical protein